MFSCLCLQPSCGLSGRRLGQTALDLLGHGLAVESGCDGSDSGVQFWSQFWNKYFVDIMLKIVNSCLPKSKVRQASKTPAWFKIRENTTLHTVILQPAEVPAGLCAVLYLRTLSIKDVLRTTSSLQLHTHSRGLESGSFASSGRSGSP